MNLDLPTPDSALAIVAHPDDAEFQCGATLAKWATAGATVHHLICTDGSKGTWDADCDQAALVAERQIEQRAAAAALGATGEVVFLDNVDGELTSGLDQVSKVAYWIRVLRPAVIIGHDPWKRYRLHPDHRHAGTLAVEGIVGARDPFFFPEHGEPRHRPDALLLFEAEERDHAEDVSGHAPAKTAALLEHRTQFVTTHEITEPDNPEQRARFANWVDHTLAEGAAEAGLPDGTHAELYKLIDRL
ncbi:MAG: LmbE family N-acetylglucosaminyl deacetylase [Candidatus Poriferisodalaceae bacterium]|jgi:LmbE family N-acetylglucosaminyl deacetylase